jgi:hypothetical protein
LPTAGQNDANDPGCVKTQKMEDDENNFPKLFSTKQAREVSKPGSDSWWNAQSTLSQRRCVFTRPRPGPALKQSGPLVVELPPRDARKNRCVSLALQALFHCALQKDHG